MRSRRQPARPILGFMATLLAAPLSHAAPPASTPKPTATSAPTAPRTVEFSGTCDASGAVTLAKGQFVVADDEDNVLRVYDADRGGAPLYAADVSPALELPQKKQTPEADLEAATRIGDKAFWLTSHGRNSKAKKQESRLRFFATTVPEANRPLALVGKPYHHLLEDVLAAKALAGFGLQDAEALAPKQPGGLNIEGMTARPDGKSVLVGFRNPVPAGKAIVLPLLNPLALIEGQRAQFGPPVLLDLGGRGVRSISFWRGRYLLIGGAIADEKTSMLFTWDGRSQQPRPVESVDLTDFNPEGFASFEDRGQVLLISDDGTREIEGQPCKKLTDPAKKRFRGKWVSIP